MTFYTRKLMFLLYFIATEFVPRSLLLFFGSTNNAVIRQLRRTVYFDLFQCLAVL